jgi:DNA-binding transcriptional regulator YdaS (Cro superfamily)
MNLTEWTAQRGRQTELALALECDPQLVGQWANGRRPIPPARRPAIEAATQGDVRCEDMGDDVVWRRVPDKAWKWHPKGRPLLDLTRVARVA